MAPHSMFTSLVHVGALRTVNSMEITSVSQLTELTASGTHIIDFAAEWCGPCKQLAAELVKFQVLRPDIPVATVDVDAVAEAAQTYGVMSVPTILVIKDGDVLARLVGARSAQRLADEVATLL